MQCTVCMTLCTCQTPWCAVWASRFPTSRLGKVTRCRLQALQAVGDSSTGRDLGRHELCPIHSLQYSSVIGGIAAGKGPYSHPVTRPHTLVTPINPTPSIPQHQPARPSNFWVSWSTWWLGDWLVVITYPCRRTELLLSLHFPSLALDTTGQCDC